MSRPRPKGEVGGSGWEVLRSTPGGVQAHNRGVSRPRPGGVQAHNRGISRPRPGGVQAQGDYIPACTGADTPQQKATAAGGTHPTGMPSC